MESAEYAMLGPQLKAQALVACAAATKVFRSLDMLQ